MPDELGSWMGRTLDDARATESIRIAEGWLLAETRLDPWPEGWPTAGATVPEDLRSWCMELAALSYVNNPKSVTSRQTGAVITQWSLDDQAKRMQILAAARTRYNKIGRPQGSFPVANEWPDPANPYGRGDWWYR